MSSLLAAASTAFNVVGGGGSGAGGDITSQRISVCAERLGLYAQTAQQNNATLFFNQCLSLARGIDSALANNNVPREVAKLPPIIKQVCHHKNELFLQASIMVLMLSVKNACKSGWFSSRDAEELLTLADEIRSCFYPMGDLGSEPSSFLPVVSRVISRFYPQLKLGQMLVAFEIKPGYASYIEDFQISKNICYPPHEKIRLFVAQKDNTDTSSCIVNPPNVNFLINGKGVGKRNNVIMDPGPQLPTIVNSYLKYGTNLLQAVGQSEGHYIVLLAFMNNVASSELPAIQDYVQPVCNALDSDSEIIEGASRISLNCPISCTRIKIPVKGHMCRHHQCFDLSNYLEINSRRPSWRCPCCNQSACYPEIRVDQSMVKILKELGENAFDVIISADGSWKVASETKESNEPRAGTRNSSTEGPGTQDDLCTSVAPSNICDLTEGDEQMTTADPCVQEDSKPKVISTIVNPTLMPASSYICENSYSSRTQSDGVWSPRFPSPSISATYTTRPVSQPTSGFSQPYSFVSSSGPTNNSSSPACLPIIGASWPSPATFVPPVVPVNSATRPVSLPLTSASHPSAANFVLPQLQENSATCPFSQSIPGASQPSSANFLSLSRPANYASSAVSQPVPSVYQPSSSFVPRPVITDAVSPASNRENDAFQGTGLSNSQISSQFSVTGGLDSPQLQFSQLMARSKYGNSPAILQNPNRMTDKMQTIPVQMPISGTCQHGMSFGRPSVLDASLHRQSSPSPASVVNSSGGLRVERQQNSSKSYVSPVQTRDVADSLVLRPSNSEISSGTAPAVFPNSVYRASSSAKAGYQQQPLNLRTHQSVSIPPHLIRSSNLPRTKGPPGPSPAEIPPISGAGHHTQLLAAAQRAAQAPRQSPYGHAQGASSSSTVSSTVPSALSLDTERSRSVMVTTAGTVQTVTRTENLIDLQSEQSWRPTGRMRGSLTGRAYSAALNQLMIQPTEGPQATVTPSSLSAPPNPQAPVANSPNIVQASPNPPTST